MKATLNITYAGLSADAPLPVHAGTSDFDLKRMAVELIRSGELPGLRRRELELDAFAAFAVDRFDTPLGAKRIYLRPKVPFG